MTREGPDTPLHEMNPTTRFSDRVADYVRYRPTYPREIIDAMLSGMGDPSRLMAADIGAGTGIASRLLADRGLSVIAVEPNAAMAAGAEPHPRVRYRAATAEATGLADASVDLVTCFQAFHWMRHDEALSEFARIIRPSGRLAIVSNDRDLSDPLMTAYADAIRAVGGDHPAFTRSSIIARNGLFTEPVLVEHPNTQTLDEAGFIGRAMSASYAPKDGPRGRALRLELAQVHKRFRDPSGEVTMRYLTRLWLSHPVARAHAAR